MKQIFITSDELSWYNQITKDKLSFALIFMVRQTIYSRSSTLPKKEPGKPNRDLDIVLSSEWDIESNYRAEEIHEDERISGINSTLVGESLQVEMQTTDGINLLSMQQKEEPGKTDNIMNENIRKRNSG